MLHQTVIPIPTNPPAHRHPVPEKTTTSTDRPLGRYCGHVFLYWDPDHFQKAAATGGASWQREAR